MAPFEVFDLVSHHLDPKTLAISSCVCKSWFVFMSSDHLWWPICTSHFPSLSILKLTNPTVSYRRLYVIGRAAAKRRQKTPSKPRLSLDSLIFTINIFNPNLSSNVLSLEKSGSELVMDPSGIFKFDIDVSDYNGFEAWEDRGAVRVTWNVVLEGWRGVFEMMDCEGKGMEGWFSEELPSPAGCCSSVVTSGIVADLKLGFCDGRRVKKVSVGMLSIGDWRYVSIDDALRYLQHFLLPCVV
ncbi:probable F-box protein At5g04010 [Pyrus communis]|uniref:probable F-box protein At5g04010 n=1 Tax=Pyrus communis TaxID=23211 RepID=UPI0035BEE2B5